MSNPSISMYQKLKLQFHHFFFWLQQIQAETFIPLKQSGIAHEHFSLN